MFFVQNVPYAVPISPAVLPSSSAVLGDPSSPASVALVQPPLSVASSGTWDHSQAPAEVARQISALKRGVVTYIYCITGNSAPQAQLLNMSAELAEHVEIVGYQQLVITWIEVSTYISLQMRLSANDGGVVVVSALL